MTRLCIGDSINYPCCINIDDMVVVKTRLDKRLAEHLCVCYEMKCFWHCGILCGMKQVSCQVVV